MSLLPAREGRFLVVGAGSIGTRHARNLRALGCADVAICDPSAEPRIALSEELGAPPFADLDEALSSFQPSAVVIASPPALHVGHALSAIEAGADVFVEKPLSHSVDGVDALVRVAREARRIVQVGYNLRFHPGVRALKEIVDSGRIGRVLWARIEFGQYLPDWRKGRDYRASYTARSELGGGILLDASHELDYVMWLLGRPTAITAVAAKVSDLEVDVEDSATVLLQFGARSTADVHLDFVQRGYSRGCKLCGELGTVSWSFRDPRVVTDLGDGGDPAVFEFTFDVNDMYVAEMEHFLDCIDQRREPLVGLEDGAAVLRLVLEAKHAARTGQRRELEW